ncbi:hypothetical protein BDZ89DRAFT_1059296 [Hymenopellis radicata]|nr:hypothetical protein BDZ89DRAFT_1059296 [Hymenopellis radicata]
MAQLVIRHDQLRFLCWTFRHADCLHIKAIEEVHRQSATGKKSSVSLLFDVLDCSAVS